ncbi:glycosyltransferase [Nanohaloarchaea archaeon H01]|nr:glycosyltransferase [Nanohaloarchaea archaeon H01]
MSSSLVVPAYNEEDVIDDTLDHLTHLESYFDEIYLIDDASTDSTQERIAEYVRENDTGVKVSYMRENGNKVGAIEEAVRHADSDNVVLTDADTRLETPEAVEDAEEYMDQNGYGALAFKVIPDDSPEGFIDSIWNKLQDFDYAMGRALADYTTGERLRLDPDDKNVRCIAGAGGMYDTEVLEEALQHHSGKHAGDDMETTAITQLLLDNDVDYFSDVEFETEVPKEYSELKDQRVRWNRGAIQAFSNHPKDYLKEAATMSRYGQTVAYEAGITAAAPVLLGKTALEISQGDLAQATESFAFWYGVDATFTTALGAYSLKKGELKDTSNFGISPLMPLYRAGTFFPAKIGSQRQTLEEKLTEAGQEFRQGLEEGNEDIEAIRNLGNMFEASKQKAENMFSLSSVASVKEILEHD